MVWSERVGLFRDRVRGAEERRTSTEVAPADGETRRAKVLGWLGIGVGVTKLFAPRAVSRVLGLSDGPGTRMLLRVLGAGSVAAGVATLRSTDRATAASAVVRKAATIGRTREDVYRRWREMELPRGADIVEDRPNELVSWRAPNDDSGTVRFTQAPGGRGTEVHLEVRRRPLAAHRAGRELHRFKQIMETGDVVHSDATVHRGRHPAQPSAGPVELPRAAQGGAR